MKILRVNHLGIVPKDKNIAKSFFGEVLGLVSEGSEVVADQKVEVDFLKVDDTRLELLSATSAESPIHKFLETRGAGIQHIALEVDDIFEWLTFLQQKGIKVIDSEPKSGAHNTLIAFIHPHSTGGILVELVQEKNNSYKK